MALGEAKTRAKDEFRRAVAASGYTLEQVRDFVANRRDLRRPLQHIVHRPSLIGRAANFFEHGIHGGDLFLSLRMTDVYHMDEEIGLDDFLKRRLERLDEPMRQLADETDGVGEQHALVCWQAQAARRRVKRRE